MGPTQSLGYISYWWQFDKPECNAPKQPRHLQVPPDSNEHTAFAVERLAYGYNVSTHLQCPNQSAD